ncbi:MAG: hypothetical protein CSYNP_00680 [Syntrophus sp. SKADARSKE-3]|nr:hypothetical protein [Syntrophus sp. SKADARSKE-3]
MAASEKDHMRRCASLLVIATYGKVRLIPRNSHALPMELFARPLSTVV